MSVPDRPAGALLDRAATRGPSPLADLAAPEGGILVIAPHPDDETLGCGLAIRAALAAGRDVGVLLLTGGGGSHPASRSHPPAAMVALRRREFAAALDALASGLPADAGTLCARTLDEPDGAVPHSPPGSDGAFQAARAFARDLRAATLWVTWGGDPHIDHAAAAALADRLVARWGGPPPTRRDYAVWGRFGAAGVRVDTGDLVAFDAPIHRPAKRAAMAAYRSQLTPMVSDDPNGFVMPPALVEHFAEAPELFVIEPENGTVSAGTAMLPRRGAPTIGTRIRERLA